MTKATEKTAKQGVRTVALVSALTAPSGVGYVGLQNREVRRTAAWTFHRNCRVPGKIGILLGNHRCRCQELNESAFRSYPSEHSQSFKLLERLTTLEDRM